MPIEVRELPLKVTIRDEAKTDTGDGGGFGAGSTNGPARDLPRAEGATPWQPGNSFAADVMPAFGAELLFTDTGHRADWPDDDPLWVIDLAPIHDDLFALA